MDVDRYIGQSWEQVGGCWGLVRLIHREQMGIELPAVDVEAAGLEQMVADGRRTWREVGEDGWLAGDVILLRSRPAPYHVGVFIGGRRMIHATREHGVSAPRISNLYRPRMLGIYRHPHR